MFSLENDKYEEYIKKIPDLSPKEKQSIKFILDSGAHERKRYIERLKK